jgi:thiol-disulfide isomerase/thioredoxin
MRRGNRFCGVMATLALAAFGATAFAQNAPNSKKEAPKGPTAQDLVGKPAPELEVAGWLNADGKEITLKSLRGKMVLVEFWATWCPPCRAAIPELEKFHQQLRNRGVVVLALSGEKDKDKIEAFIKEHKMSYIVGYGDKSGKDYHVRTIPTAFVVDPKGVVVFVSSPGGAEAHIRKLAGVK